MSYPLASTHAEFERLQHQHDTWRQATEAVWRLAGFRAGHELIDLGCGPGATTMDLARIAGPTGRVLGIDASEAAADAARRAAREQGLPRVQIVTTTLEGWRPASASADGVFARWLFCYLERPRDVLATVSRALRPGGTVALVDYWHYLAIRSEPASPVFDEVFRAVFRSFADAGGSLDVGGALPAHCEAVGLSVQHLEPIIAVGRPGSSVWRWIAEFQALYLPSLVERGYLTRRRTDEYLAWWASLEGSPSAFVFAPPMLAVVAVKP